MKTAYRLAANLVADFTVIEDSPWKKLWSIKVPPRMKSLYWRLCKGWISTRSKLLRRGICVSALCPCCDKALESDWHIFVDCDFGKSCWLEGDLWDIIDRLAYQVETHTELFLKLIHAANVKTGEKLAAIAWQIWKSRNGII